MRVAHIGWFAVAVAMASAGCGDRVLVGEQALSGTKPPAAPPVNQTPPAPPVNQTPPAPLPSSQPMPGTPPPSCVSPSPAQFVPGPGNTFANGPGIFSLAYSPDGQIIAGGIEGPLPNVRLWNAADSSVLRDLPGHGPGKQGVTYGVLFSPDSRILATAGLEAVESAPGGGHWSNSRGTETVKLWDVASGSLLRVIPATCGYYAMSLAFSHDGTLLATAGANGPIEIWRVADSVLVTSIPYLTTVYGVHFSPDDARLISAGMDGVATIWRVSDGMKLLTLSSHFREVADAVFSPDGREIATGGFDYTVRLWDAQTGAPRKTLAGHSRYLSRVIWIDQDRLASNDWFGTVILWTRDSSGAFSSSCSLSTNAQSLGLDVSPDRTKLIASGGSSPDGLNPGFWIFPL